MKLAFLMAALLALPLAEQAQSASPLANALVLIIRHAEKPADGRGLSPAGEAHARWYVSYFRDFKIDGQPVKLDCLIAARDSKNSKRPGITLQPLSKALNLPVQSAISDKEPGVLARELQAKSHGRNILICWHHGEMGALLRALGAPADNLLPGGEWPVEQFGWVVVLRYDAQGHLIPAQCRRIVQPAFS